MSRAPSVRFTGHARGVLRSLRRAWVPKINDPRACLGRKRSRRTPETMSSRSVGDRGWFSSFFPTYQCSNVRMYVAGRRDHANFECEPETRPGTEGLQSDWRESVGWLAGWRSFSFNFSIRPAHLRASLCSRCGSVRRPARARFSRAWPSANFSFAFHHGDVSSFDVSIVCTRARAHCVSLRERRARVCVHSRPPLYFASTRHSRLWIRAMAAYWILLRSIYRCLVLLFIRAHVSRKTVARGAAFGWILRRAGSREPDTFAINIRGSLARCRARVV